MAITTPVISHSQQKLSLSAKKMKKTPTKNILASVYEHYWPELSLENNNIIIETLENNLHRIRPEKVCIPWKNIKDIPKEERKSFRMKIITENSSLIGCENGQNIVFGVNQVSNGLEKNELTSVMIASDVQPKLMVKHIIDLAVLKGIPVLIVKSLRCVLKARCGVSSVCFALKKPILKETKLSLIQEEIERMHENHPAPKDHINFLRNQRLPVGKTGEDSQHKKITENMTVCENVTKYHHKSKKVVTNPMQDKIENLKERQKKYYLPKKPLKTIPSEFNHLLRQPTETNDFISFTPCNLNELGNNEESNRTQSKEMLDKRKYENVPGSSPVSTIKRKHDDVTYNNYKSIIIKKLKGDNNRNKRKLENIKHKK